MTAMTSDTSAKISATLSARAVPGGVEAHLRFENRGASVGFLYRINACVDGRILNDVFVLTSKGVRMAYTGKLAKRRRPILEDYLELRAGQTAEATVRLDQGYRFLEGPHAYALRYEAIHQYPDNDDYFELVSNEALFTFQGARP